LAASIDGVLTYQNAGALDVNSVAGTNGIATMNHDVTLTTGGQLTLDQSVNAGNNAGTVVTTFAVAQNGVDQKTGSAVTSDQLLLTGTGPGNFMLNQAGNSVGRLAAAIDGALTYQNAGALDVNSVGGTNNITTSNHDVTLTTGGLLTLDQSVDAGNNAGAVVTTFAVALNGVNQTGGAVTSDQLLLTGTGAGAFTLKQANAISQLAASVKGAVSLNDAQSLTVGLVKGTLGITTAGNTLALDTTNNFTVNDGGAGISVIDTGSAATTVHAGVGATTGTFIVDVEGQINTTKGATITGAQGTDANLLNTFIVRPGSGMSTAITAIGNQMVAPNACRDTLNLPRESVLIEALGNPKPGDISLMRGGLPPDPNNFCNGRFTFTMDAKRTLTYFGFNFVGGSVQVKTVQTATKSFDFRVQLGLGAFSIGSPQSFTPPAVNNFILSPTFASPGASFSAPRVAVANLRGFGETDIIVGDGPGAPPLVTVLDGLLITTSSNLTQAVLSRFFAFDPHFMGGIDVAAGALTKGGKASIVVSEDFNAPQPFVRIFNTIPGKESANNPKQLVPSAQFLPYGANFHGGVRVAIGDVQGNAPIIVTAPGPGAALPVEVFDGATLTFKQSLFPYGPNYSDGIYVAVSNLYQTNKMKNTIATNDILTGPEAGDPVLKIYLGNKPLYSTTPDFCLLPFRNGTGTQLATGNTVRFGANSPIFGVSSVAFGSTFSNGSTRDIDVATGIGNTAFEVMGPIPDSILMHKANPTPNANDKFIKPPPARRSMFAKKRSPRGVNLAAGQGTNG
jgi:hypothetical protein